MDRAQRERERSLTSSIALSLSHPCGIPHRAGGSRGQSVAVVVRLGFNAAVCSATFDETVGIRLLSLTYKPLRIVVARLLGSCCSTAQGLVLQAARVHFQAACWRFGAAGRRCRNPRCPPHLCGVDLHEPPRANRCIGALQTHAAVDAWHRATVGTRHEAAGGSQQRSVWYAARGGRWPAAPQRLAHGTRRRVARSTAALGMRLWAVGTCLTAGCVAKRTQRVWAQELTQWLAATFKPGNF
eukprot:365265-Chlamydomonas_euryale.AAC.4